MAGDSSLGLGSPERDRDHAERRYVAALEALDAAAALPPVLTSSVAATEADIARIDRAWNQSAAAGGPFRRWLVELSRLLPWRRRALNGAMIAAIHRQAEATRALVDATRHFQSHVVWYGQTVAAFSRNQRHQISSEDIASVQRAFHTIAADWQKHWDALDTREQRYDARTSALTHAYEELRDIVGLAQQSTLSLKRAVETLQTAGPAAGPSPAAREAGAPVAAAPSTTAPDTNAFKYVAFEDRFRGSSDDIRARLLDYLPLFEGASNVLDVGCGRGELLELLRERQIDARGIDVNDAMVEACRDRGLVADRADALAFVSAQPDASLGGLIAIQVVEHLEPTYLMQLIETAFHKLRPGAPLVLETINAACWTAFFESYIRDFTHVRPLHPETLRYLVQAGGFATAEIRFRAPVAEHDKLPVVKLPAPAVPETPASTEAAIRDLAEAINGHADRLNSRLFTYRDFAVVARR
jgi:2-polyprenyl-3-methyl-5-hydroxy-6-metoxy-1,4-benzoquinol methylase